MKTKADVAKYLEHCIAASGKTLKEIAQEIGYESPNILSMLKSGDTKVPLARIPAIAKATGTDPKVLLDLCLEAYHPELYQMLSDLAPGMLISREELQLVRFVRRALRAPAAGTTISSALRALASFGQNGGSQQPAPATPE